MGNVVTFQLHPLTATSASAFNGQEESKYFDREKSQKIKPNVNILYQFARDYGNSILNRGVISDR